MKRPVFAFIILIFGTSLHAQEQELSDNYLEGMEAFQEEDGAQFEVENLMDLLNELKSHKLDLNQASEEDFEQLPFLNDIDAHNLIRHRELYGNYQTLFELKNIPDFDEAKIKQILSFVEIEEKKSELSLLEMVQDGTSQIFISGDRYLQKKAGYEKQDGTSAYAGPPIHYYSKYLYGTSHIKASFVGEQDAGESIWSHQGKIFDFLSGSIAVEGLGKIKQICVGDYKANFGQGLIIGTGSILGKNVSVTNGYKNSQGLKRYASTGESDYLRGVGVTIGGCHLSATLFGSFKKGDATLNGEKISSFKTDGMHRTPTEISKKKNHWEQIGGCNVQYKRSRYSIGYTFLHYHYSRELHPTQSTYTHFRLNDIDHHWNMGIHYKVKFHHITLYGESALDANGHFATLNGAALFPLSRLEITIAQRHYSPAYQSNYGKGFSENSRIENEEGIYLSARFSPFKRITLAAYADSYRFPWATYSASMPSSGQEFCMIGNIKITPKIDETIKYKYKGKEDASGGKRTLRSTQNVKIHNWRLQTIAEMNQSETHGEKNTYGWIVSQSLTGEIHSLHLSLSMRYAYFQATQYDNRIYIYEKDLPYTLSFPMHYGVGHRIATGLMWRPQERVQFHAKIGWFIYTDGRESIGTGNELILGNVSTQVKTMMKLSF